MSRRVPNIVAIKVNFDSVLILADFKHSYKIFCSRCGGPLAAHPRTQTSCNETVCTCVVIVYVRERAIRYRLTFTAAHKIYRPVVEANIAREPK